MKPLYPSLTEISYSVASNIALQKGPDNLYHQGATGEFTAETACWFAWNLTLIKQNNLQVCTHWAMSWRCQKLMSNFKLLLKCLWRTMAMFTTAWWPVQVPKRACWSSSAMTTLQHGSLLVVCIVPNTQTLERLTRRIRQRMSWIKYTLR